MVIPRIHHRKAASRKRRGIALVDVLVGVVILGVALAVMSGLTANAVSAQRTGEQFQTAAMLLDEQLNLVVAHGADDYESAFSTEGSCDAPFQAYRYKVDISGGEGGSAYRVVATITWTDGPRDRTVSAETLIAPRLGDEPDPDRRPVEVPERL